MKWLSIIGLTLLTSCNTIPDAPSRNEELVRKCAKWAYDSSLSIKQDLESKKPPKEILGHVQGLIWATGAINEWVGDPDKLFKGDIKVLVGQMDEDDTEYRKAMTEWEHEVKAHKDSNLWDKLLLVGLIVLSIVLILAGLGIFLAFKGVF